MEMETYTQMDGVYNKSWISAVAKPTHWMWHRCYYIIT